jgi:seryl-tRNA synthetase
MISLKFIRENSDLVKEAIERKNETVDLDLLLERDGQRRQLVFLVENLKKERNENSNQVAKIKKEGGDVSQLIISSKKLGEKIKNLDSQLLEIESEIQKLLDRIPNIPHVSTPVGKTAESNVQIASWGRMPDFDFPAKDHLTLGDELNILDFKRGGKISGSGFPVYKGLGARLERALINFMLDIHIQQHGYTEIFPPFLTNRLSMYGTGQLPKLEEDMYLINSDDLFLIPTAEVPVSNLHRDEIIPIKKLPIRYVAYSACFRREAGSYGKETRGFLRVHQFNKVELVNFTLPEESYAIHEKMLGEVTKILQLLELPYRILSLATGDLSFAAAKCYDVETWSPAEEKWLETSSVSNFEDFQARRMNIRFKREKTLEFVHTLNGSGLATSRLMISLLEMNQTDEGTIIIPQVLRPYMNNISLIKREYK